MEGQVERAGCNTLVTAVELAAEVAEVAAAANAATKQYTLIKIQNLSEMTCENVE